MSKNFQNKYPSQIRVEVVRATPQHVAEIARAVRPADREELWACRMQTPEQVMQRGIEMSDKAMAGLVNGRAVCMWGVVHDSLIGPCGTPWMVGTMALDEYAKTFLRRCKKGLVDMFEGYQHLENFVDARNTKAIQWLKWLGFNVDKEPQEYGMLKLPFHKFTMRREINV